MTFCQFGSLSTEFIRCSEDSFHLKTCSYNDIIIVLTEAAVCISCRKELTRKELDEDTYEECSPKIKDTSIQCIDNLNESQNTIETQADVITHETCQMEFDGSNIFSDSETIEPQSTQESQASYQREEALQYLNSFLEVNGSKTISSLLLKSWFELSQKS
ncbi:unnamed protein product [Mytilus coruscus]|uniref:Uncharacterized protein n=1 Tax=Mytilus coruscus TaxID=42192 RepID=A0A6J8C9F7_MYTCO|nr:unnamed protein product [Mytilus coruscus]